PVPPASQGAVAYPPATMLSSSFSNQQSSHTNAFQAATNVGTPAAFALTPYNHQPEALASVPPSSSSAGSTFLPPAAGSHGAGAAYQASIPVPLSSQNQAAFQR